MSQNREPQLDEDLTLHFRWRWAEHGIYLAVCSAIGLFVLALHVVPPRDKPRFDPHLCDIIQVRYLSAADEIPEAYDPLRDPRLIRLPRTQAQGKTSPHAM